MLSERVGLCFVLATKAAGWDPVGVLLAMGEDSSGGRVQVLAAGVDIRFSQSSLKGRSVLLRFVSYLEVFNCSAGGRLVS